MALVSNALTSVAKLRRYMKTGLREADFLRIYHDGTGVTSATVQVTATTLELVTNIGTDSLTLSDSATLSALITAIDALSNWTATQLGDDDLTPTDLGVYPATDALLIAKEQYLVGVDAVVLTDAINAASDFIHRWCGRTDFASTAYRRRLSGAGHDTLIVPDGPVTAVAYVSMGTVRALQLKYETVSVRRARVSVDGTSLILVTEAGTTTTTSLTLASNDLDALVVLINAVSGWTSQTLAADSGGWPSTDLLKTENQNARGGWLTMDVPDDPIDGYTVDQEASILRRIDDASDMFPVYRHSRYATPPRVHLGPVWPYGNGNVVVSYTAGYSTIPADVEQVCNELAANYVRGGRHDTGLSGESVAGYSRTASGEGPFTVAMEGRLSGRKMLAPVEFMDV